MWNVKNKFKAVVAILIFSLSLAACNQGPKLAYVNNFKLFEEFQGTLELDAKHRAESSHRQQALDSIKAEISAMAASDLDEDAVVRMKTLEKRYNLLLQQFNQETTNSQQRYQEQLWTQINQYVFEYGKEQQYDYVFGSAANGSLMYADEAEDITADVIAYINKKYAGK